MMEGMETSESWRRPEKIRDDRAVDTPTVVFRDGCLESLADQVRTLGASRVLIVTDPGIVRAGILAEAERILARGGIAATVFADVHENPTAADVDAGLAIARDFQPEGIVGLGGGSAMDAAKGIDRLLVSGGTLVDYWKAGNPEARVPAEPLLPLIAIPTTAGTGSEVQSHALLADTATHRKMAIPNVMPTLTLLDPILTLSCPPFVTDCAGIDALAHAVETWVTTRRTPASDALSRQAFARILPNLSRVRAHPQDRDARGALLRGAMEAGAAIERSMLGAAHAMANPLTAHFGIVHGVAVGLLLPHVVRFNAEDPAVRARYDALLPGQDLPATLTACLIDAELPVSLATLGVTDDSIETLADDAVRQWTLGFNPRPLTRTDLARLYRRALMSP
jgi:alcohol dehydrogenase